MTDDLTTWLRAALNAEEAALIRKRDGHEGPCINFAGQDPEHYDEYDTCSRHIAVAEATPYRDAAFGLADVDAKRRILDRHIMKTGEHVTHGICAECGGSDWKPGVSGAELDPFPWVMPWPCPTLKLLALSYASQPGYQEKWRPA